ncbi:hypothetical protein [Balneicella halophila]|uniref:hypothetical protein n=1 Tax=Balneicella halophila TaxID=1537566 RepID=UPI000E301BCB|nr:hypothetical protein [Balneicella halophila]
MSCDDDNDGVKAPIDIPTPVKDVEFPFASFDGSKIPVIGPIDLNFDADQYLKDNVPLATIDNVKSAKLKDFIVELEDSSFKGDLTAIRDAEVYLKATNPDHEEIKVAWVIGNTNGEKIEFEVDDSIELLPYFKAEDQYLYLRNIVGGDGSLTTFTVKLTPKWEMSFGV